MPRYRVSIRYEEDLSSIIQARDVVEATAKAAVEYDQSHGAGWDVEHMEFRVVEVEEVSDSG